MKTKVATASGPVLNGLVATCEGYRLDLVPESSFDPSTDWSQGGPIIERENITGLQKSKHLGTGDVLWHCFIDNSNFQVGPTPLIAAMRCYVASKLGEEVEVPNELTNPI